MAGRVMTTDTPTWLDYGPAEFDKRRAPKGTPARETTQGALFFAAIPPVPARPAKLPPELPGQGSLLDEPEVAS